MSEINRETDGLKILALNWRDRMNPEAGGAETHIHEILRRLADRGHDITLLAAGYPEAEPETHYDGLRVLRAGNGWNANWVLPFRARRLMREQKFDVVIEDVNKIPFFIPWLSKLPHLLVIPHLFGGTVFRETNPLFATYVFLPELLIPRVYRKSRVLAISPSTRDDLIRRGLDADRIDVSYCGFEAGIYDMPNPPAPDPDQVRLVHLGRLRKYKGADLVLQSFVKIRERIPTATLDIIGDGPERPELLKLASRLQIGDAVRFHGHVPLKTLVDILYRCHLFLNASPKEGWGLTVIEAAACGLPCIAADSPGLRDSVRDGETGILVPYGDVPAMAEAALTLLEDEDRRSEMGRLAARRAREFSWDTTALETEGMLDRLVAEAGGNVR
ncbi:MAG: glycosyltransferase family 4 protein [bacterium]|nr:glycosyltransferase family 4 protein [bacterium]